MLSSPKALTLSLLMVQAHADQLLNQKNDASVPQSHLYIATKRLRDALARLEKNLQQMTVTQDRDVHQEKQLTAFERENETLRRDRKKLNDAVTQLQSQYGDLHQVASAIYGKLDDSIRRLTKIIEH